MKKIFCRCCKEKSLLKYLNLGKQPLANSYHKKEKLDIFPLEVNLCKTCFHSQLSVVVNPDVMFRNYLYVSGTTETFKKHCIELAKDAVRRIDKNPKDIFVLDIACNDGSQLEYFRDLNCNILGVDPAKNLLKITKKKKIPVIVDYWNPQIAKKIKSKFDIITGTNVFAHVDDLDEFLQACRMVIAKKGLVILEFPYANEMIKNNEFDTIYHEHLSYFTVNSFSTLAARLQFEITEVIQTPIHGGGIRFFLRDSSEKHCKKVSQLIKKEKNSGLLNIKAYKDFSRRVEGNRANMVKLLKKLEAKKIKVVGYGASAKGNTMLNYFKISPEYIVDDNNLKWNYFTPGRNIPITSPHELKKESNKLAVIILSWNFYNEIVKKIQKIRGKRKDDRFIKYVPNVKMVRG